MVDLESMAEFDAVDVLITDEMEELCIRIRMAAEMLQSTSCEKKQTVRPENAVHKPLTISLPKIELPNLTIV